jgi:hypothetical protein
MEHRAEYSLLKSCWIIRLRIFLSFKYIYLIDSKFPINSGIYILDIPNK